MTQKQVMDLKDHLSVKAFGVQLSEYIPKGRCVNCKEDAMGNCYSEAGKKEFYISGLCEVCFDKITEKINLKNETKM